MSQTTKKLSVIKILIISLVILGITLIGFGVGVILKFYSHSNPTKENITDTIIVPDKLIKDNQIKIDSLNKVIEEREKSIRHLKDSIEKIEAIRTIEVDNVKRLPLDSALIYLNLKLGEYYDRYN